MFNWFFSRRLESVLYATRTVKVRGIKFKIRKVANIEDFYPGSEFQRSLKKFGSMPQDWTAENAAMSDKLFREHFGKVIVRGVVSPKISDKSEPNAVPIADLFSDQKLVEQLYSAIVAFSFGKRHPAVAVQAVR